MNKPLIRAAAVVNIVAASLIYVACSGDDGKDGKDGCIITKTLAGDYDVTCSGTPIGTISGSGGGGADGSGCTATPFAGGVNIQCGGADKPSYPLYDGQGGGGPGTGCSISAIDAPDPLPGQTLNGDQVINIRCADNRSASILVCPVVLPTSPNGATGLLFNVDGQLGRCRADGTITRTEQATLNCNGVMFDAKKEFCQRTLLSRSTPTATDSGYFVTYNKATGQAGAGAYPTGYDAITNPESNYNMAGRDANVKSVVLPLCGVPALTTTNTSTIAQNHIGGLNSPNGSNTIPSLISTASRPTVYNALQHCGRNLVFKIGDATGGNASDTWNGKTVEGGQLDKNGGYPFSEAWSVQANGQCYIGLRETNFYDNQYGQYGFGLNGFTFTGTTTAASASAPCSFLGAVQSATTPPYSTCPEGTPLVALDDVGCVARESCQFHSTIDNTCLVGKETGSLFGKTTYDSAYVIIYDINGTGSGGDTVSSFRNYSENPTVTNDRGIYRTKLGSRFGRGVKPDATLERGGNMWSRECKTLTASRLGFYAVNDPYLTNKKWKDNWTVTPLNTVASGTTNGTTLATGQNVVPPPICGGVGLNDSTITPIPFDDAFACVKGQLSVYYAATSQTNDGNAWNRPIYCVQTGGKWDGIDKPTPACYISAPEINEGNCQDGEIDQVTSGASVAINTATWSSDEEACKIENTTTAIIESVCTGISAANVPQSTPIIAVPNLTATEGVPANATHGGLLGTWNTNTWTKTDVVEGTTTTTTMTGGCILTATQVSGGIAPFSPGNCKNISSIKQAGAGEIGANGYWATIDGSARCLVVAKSGVNLSTYCGQIDLVRSFDLSTKSSTPVNGSWK